MFSMGVTNQTKGAPRTSGSGWQEGLATHPSTSELQCETARQ